MRKTEQRDVVVKYCDYCGEESTHLDKCVICKREMCTKEGGATHAAFHLDIYRYGDGKRLIGARLCCECGLRTPPALALTPLFDMMLGDTPVLQVLK